MIFFKQIKILKTNNFLRKKLDYGKKKNFGKQIKILEKNWNFEKIDIIDGWWRFNQEII